MPIQLDHVTPSSGASRHLLPEGEKEGCPRVSLLLNATWYQALRVSPAMAAGVSDQLWDIADIALLVVEAEAKPGERGPYKKRKSA